MSLGAHAQNMLYRDFLPGVEASRTREALIQGRCANPRNSADDRIEDCKEYLSHGHPGDLATLYALADAYRRSGDYANALSTLDRALSELRDADRSDRMAFTTERAIMIVEQGNRAEVEPAIQQITAVAPNAESLYADRCWLRAVAGAGLDLAVADCNAALALEPEDYAPLDSLALANLKLGKWDACIAWASEALKHNSQLPSSLYMRGYCEDRTGDHTNAAKDVESAKSFDPGVDELLAKDGVPQQQD